MPGSRFGTGDPTVRFLSVLDLLGPDVEVLGRPKLKEEFLKFLQNTQSKYLKIFLFSTKASL